MKKRTSKFNLGQEVWCVQDGEAAIVKAKIIKIVKRIDDELQSDGSKNFGCDISYWVSGDFCHRKNGRIVNHYGTQWFGEGKGIFETYKEAEEAVKQNHNDILRTLTNSAFIRMNKIAKLTRTDVETDEDYEMVKKARKFCEDLKKYNRIKYDGKKTPIILC